MLLIFPVLDTVVSNRWMVEASRRQNRMGASSERGHGSERAVVPQVDGWNTVVTSKII
jgi:hypothetical protein